MDEHSKFNIEFYVLHWCSSQVFAVHVLVMSTDVLKESCDSFLPVELIFSGSFVFYHKGAPHPHWT